MRFGTLFRTTVALLCLGGLLFLMLFADDKELKAGGWPVYVVMGWAVALLLYLAIWVRDKRANRERA